MFVFAFQTGSMKLTHTQKQTHYLCGQCKQISYEKETDYVVKTEKFQPVHLI